MKQLRSVVFAFIATCFGSTLGAEQGPRTSPSPLAWASPTNSAGTTTNGPAVYRLSTYSISRTQPNPRFLANQRMLASTNPLPAVVRERLRTNRDPEFLTNVVFFTNREFQYFLPGTLNHLIWTNVLAATNSHSIQMWSTRAHPQGWPATKVVAAWNRRSLVYGMKGFTALSPCWELEGSSGQIPITALTRRHGYARGHGMGPAGFREVYAGKKVWFVDPSDTVVEVKILREVVRTEAGQDYTIMLFDRDLPASVQPMRVINSTNLFTRFVSTPDAPLPVYFTEQDGNSSLDLPGFRYGFYKGGDSGSANLLPMPGELVFIAGRSTATPSPLMQADMDELCRLEKLNPSKYQMQWLDISSYPVP